MNGCVGLAKTNRLTHKPWLDVISYGFGGTFCLVFCRLNAVNTSTFAAASAWLFFLTLRQVKYPNHLMF